MACLLNSSNDWEITIPDSTTESNYTVYNINVRIGSHSWVARHRYSDFAKLHQTLNFDHGIPKDALPPKKVIGNLDPQFIESRRAGLEKYINYVFSLLRNTIPKMLILFLRLDEFDILFILQKLAEDISNRTSLSHSRPSNSYKFSVLQVHAICERLRMPCPQLEGANHAFSVVLDLCEHLNIITISGEPAFFYDSRINKAQLYFDLACFKRLQVLNLIDVSVQSFSSAQEARLLVTRLKVEKCRLTKLNDLLLCDEVHKDWNLVGKEKTWSKLKDMDLSLNALDAVDGSVSLIPGVTTVNLSYNKLIEIPNLSALLNLENLFIQSNGISNLSNVKFQLPVCSITLLDLSENKVAFLKGLEVLVSLKALNLSSNVIKDMDQVNYISSLPKIECIVLTGNPISTFADYRVKVLEKFGSRYHLVRLDNEESSQKELDTVAVLQALRVVREGKSPFLCRLQPQTKQ